MSEGTFSMLRKLLSTSLGGNNYIEVAWDTGVNPLLTHNTSLTLCLLSTTKPGTSRSTE